jgi:hypothetical protein
MSFRRTLLAFAIVLPACSPYLEAQTREAHRYTSPIRCAQGPYEFKASMSGARWGEGVKLVQLSGQPISGHAEIWIDGAKSSEWDLYPWTPPAPAPTTTTASSPPAPIASAKPSDACQLSEADRGAPAPARGAPGPGAPGMPGEGGVTTPTPGTTVTATTPKLVEVPADGSAAYSYGHEIAGWSVRVEHATDTEFPLKAGAEIRLVIWSPKLLDLAGLELAFVHEVYVPSCGDEKWAARLAKEKADADAESKKGHAEEERCRDLATKNTLDDACRKLGWHDTNEVARCQALVPKNSVDEACRRLGYENASVSAERLRCQAAQKSNLTDDACHKLGYWNDADSAKAPGASGPKGPPPPPRAEERPPQPSEHAEWVPGSWEWSASTGVSGAGGEWSWVGGGWKVPEVDRQAKATPTAPTQPPAARAETPGAPPVTGLVWVGGYWHYAGGQWVWVPGRWARPPQSGATWRPHVWVQENGKIRLDPGQWQIGR